MGHNVGFDAELLGQLILHLKGAYRLHLIAEEVNAEGKFGRKTKHVEYRPAEGVFSRFVDVVPAVETHFFQSAREGNDVVLFAGVNGEGVVGQFLTRSHPFGQCRGKGHDAERHGVLLGRGTFPSAQSGEYVGTEDLLCRIALAVFHCPAIGRGEEQYALVAQQLPQVVVEVARLLFVVEHEEVGGWTFVSCCPQHQCRSRTAQPFE